MPQYSLDLRARTFDDIYGHTKIINEFKNRSKTLDYPDVMVMSGISGGGKTSVSFIIAKLLNCKNPIKHADGHQEPCDICESCKDVNEGRFGRDIFFKDGSQMGKEDVKKLDELVNNYAMFDKNIILIIDEAQHLTAQAKGATLTFLEKNRKNVYIILCTMNFDAFDDKAKVAVKRRSQFYNFRELSSEDIAEYMAFILKKEGLFETLPEEFIFKGLFFLANNCNGSPGLGLSYLNRCVMGEIYTESEMTRELDIVSDSIATNILEKLLKKDKSVFVDLKNIEIKEFFAKSFKILRDACIYKYTGFVDQQWKEKNAKILSQYDTIFSLVDTFDNVKNDGYFNENSFYVELFDYYDFKVKVEENKKESTSQSQPQPQPNIRRRVVKNNE